MLISFTIYLLLNTFVLSSSLQVATIDTSNLSTGEVTSTTNTYSDDNVTITLKEYRENDTTIYVADVEVKDSSLLKTAFANNTYGKNVTEKTSTIASSINAILAINGDYYGVQEYGYVLKNGTIYRNTAKSNQQDLVIYKDG